MESQMHGKSLRSQPVVLVVEDEKEIAEIIMSYLARDDLKSIHASDGETALELHSSMSPDLVVLDVKIPMPDGWNVLAEIRRRGDTPVIMLTANDHDLDKLMALRMGADDYVVKPFNPAEVSARAMAILRRSRYRASDSDKSVIRMGRLIIDMDTFQVFVSDEAGSQSELILTLTEFKLLSRLALKPKRVHTRTELLIHCLPDGEALERTVDSHISKLRKKLELAGLEGLLGSQRGVGYKMSVDR